MTSLHNQSSPNEWAITSNSNLNDSLSVFEQHRILSMTEVSSLLGRSKSMLYLDLDPKSKYFKPNFPQPIKVSNRTNGWLASEIYTYINSLTKGV